MLEPMLQPESDPEHAERVAAFLRTLSDAKLSQVIATPDALVDGLPGFTHHHLRTLAERVVVQLAKHEQQRRRDDQTDRRSRRADRIAKAALVVSALALILSIWARLAP
jgi:hypothetical protein